MLGLRTVCTTTMPYAAIHTNQTLPKEKQRLLLGVVSDLVASQLGKPKQYVMASIVEGLPMVFAGDDSPAAFLELSSIGVPDQKREPLCARLTEISAQTAIPPERIYIVLTDVSRHLWAQGGKTFG
jgi:phenylpyruvate tautomerase